MVFSDEIRGLCHLDQEQLTKCRTQFSVRGTPEPPRYYALHDEEIGRQTLACNLEESLDAFAGLL